MTAPTRRVRKPVPSIQDAPVSTRHLIADEDESVEDRDARRLRKRPAPHGEPELDLGHHQAPIERSFHVTAEINQGCVDFRVSGKSEPITFEELAAVCAEQLPGVVLERRTKWLQYTFDLWSHAGQCLYSIPIASLPAPAPASPPSRKARRHPSELAAHHPRG
ncbi:hypothetical protein LJR290_007705 [Variovorax sp. LjRoot290]|uniref:hypothetical protein n=1 Tax=unclassified Variovorax TaxID=663243 RepID=UPI003ED1753E